MSAFTRTMLMLALWLAAPAMAQQPRAGGLTGLAADAELVETRTEVPRLQAPAAYVMRDNTLELELSEYAGYAGLIAANKGLEPNEDSIFFRKHGFKVKITISEAESWSALNAGRLAASATTADVLAVFGRQFQVVVPAQIGFSRGADAVVVQSGIRKVNDLKGKTLASVQFTEADFFIRYLAQEAGLTVNTLPDLKTPADPTKLNLVYCGDAEGAAAIFSRDLKSGRNRLAGCVSWAPFTTEAVESADGKASILVSNRNLLVIADILVVNKGFAQANPKVIAGLVAGLLEGNRMVRDNANAHLDVIAKAFKWDREETRSELAKVHLSNLPENLAFFSGAIDAAGSFGGIYQSAVYAYGRDLIRSSIDAERFVDLAHLKAIEQGGTFKDQKIAIAPIRSANATQVEGDPLLSKDIRFLFEPNSSKLDMAAAQNIQNLELIKKLLQVSPGSTVLLCGHVDPGRMAEFRKAGGEQLVRTQTLRAIALSKDRAAAVRQVLVENLKLDTERIDSVGRGWDEPIGTESEQNRRVEVQWFTLE